MYEIKQVSDTDYLFTTKEGLIYRATFGDGSGYFSPRWRFAGMVSVFSFQVVGGNAGVAPVDPNIKYSIAAIIDRFLEVRPNSIVFFIYDSSDGKALGRQRKFDGWYRELGQSSFNKFDVIVPIGRISILASLIVRNDHPDLKEIADGFDAIVIESTTKPDED